MDPADALRLWWLTLLGMNFQTTVCALTLVLSGCASQEAGAAPPPVPAAESGPRAIQILRDWDAARSQAWAQGDPEALADLYLPGAVAGARDLALLDRYGVRGVEVSGIRMQVLSVRTVVKRPRRLRLVVVERFAGGVATSDARSAELPTGVPVRRVIEFRKRADRWLVAGVRPWPREGLR